MNIVYYYNIKLKYTYIVLISLFPTLLSEGKKNVYRHWCLSSPPHVYSLTSWTKDDGALLHTTRDDDVFDYPCGDDAFDDDACADDV